MQPAKEIKVACTQQWLRVAVGECSHLRDCVCEASAAPSALLRATARVLHLFVAGLGAGKDSKELFIWCFQLATSAFSDSLPDKLWLCTCLGALTCQAEMQNMEQCSVTIESVKLKGLHGVIPTTLEQVAEVRSTSSCHRGSVLMQTCLAC